ncbi:MAG: hypothetical protein PHQ40_15660 [Anaerolineaceae bacterium]|nr:hypothetical protein [Anaerolineaceae bacterium]
MSTLVPRNRYVVRLKTTVWADMNGLYLKKSLTFLRRKCEGVNVLEEAVDQDGAQEVRPRILNVDECEDGIYEVVTCSVDNYYYKLMPFES